MHEGAGVTATVINTSKTVVQGRFTNGMDYVSLGRGPRVVLLFNGGPGNLVPGKFEQSMYRKLFRPLLADELTVYILSRKSALPADYSTEQMAGDCAEVVEQDFGGKVHGIVGVSYGGLLIQYFAAKYPQLADRYVMLGAAYKVGEEGARFDLQFARYASAGEYRQALMHMSQLISKKRFLRTLMKGFFCLFGQVIGRAMFRERSDTFEKDILIEAECEAAHDGSAILTEVDVPLLIICGAEDEYFPLELVVKTADLIQQSELLVIEEEGHGAMFSKEARSKLQSYLSQ